MSKKCNFCGNLKHYAKGYCRNCYERFKRNGTPEYVVREKLDIEIIKQHNRERSREYYKTHYEQCRNKEKEYYKKNIEKIRKYKHEWYLKNKERFQEKRKGEYNE